MFDVLIRGGKVYDGTGAPWIRADIGVIGDRIAAIGNLRDASGIENIDAHDLSVSPGFIDIHSHSDLTILVNPRAESKVRQGVTTEVVGQCGSSPLPVNERNRDNIAQMTRDYDLDVTWTDLAGYAKAITDEGAGVNIVPIVGHSLIRSAVMGMERRPPGAAELGSMMQLLDTAMRQGARGFSSGLIYPPSSYADVDELAALCGIVAKYDGLYMTHMRNEAEGLLDSVEESIEVGSRSGVRVQISHHKAVDKPNWGQPKRSLARMEEARAAGVDVTADQYPYIASSTGLSSVVPAWAHEGGQEKMLERLRDPESSAKIRAEIEANMATRGSSWADMFITSVSVPEDQQWEGQSIQQIAEARGVAPVEAVFGLLLGGRYVGQVRFGMCEEDVCEIMRHPLVMIGSDGSCLAPYGALGHGKPHPRNYGTFVRVLGKYVRDERLLTLAEALRKMTSLPASRMKLLDRGLLRPGLAADITVFDDAVVAEQATFTDPHQYPVGIKAVLVNGRVAVHDGEHTGALSGRVLVRHHA